MEPCAEVYCQDAKGVSGREIAWAGPGVREESRRPGDCWVRGTAKDLDDGAWDLGKGVLLRGETVLSLLFLVGSLRHPPP